jgi:arabinose-5-phosphate isomerase
MIEDVQKLIRHEAEAIANIPVTDQFDRAVELIEKRVHQLKGKLVASGMGKAGQIALNIATTFSSTGTPAVFLHPSDAQHGDLE